MRVKTTAFLSFFISCAAWLGGCTPPGEGPADYGRLTNLLAGKSPISSRGVSSTERLTDSVAPHDGGHWRTNLTSVLSSTRAYAVFDLGQEIQIRCGALIGDDNDHYIVQVSRDGVEFGPLWETGPLPGGGTRTRLANNLTGSGRYVRLSASGGDGSYSVGEVALFPSCQTDWPIAFSRRVGTPLGEAAQSELLVFGFAAVAFVLIFHRRSRLWVKLLGIIPALLGIEVALTLADMWPFGESEQTLVRAVVAAIAVALVLRDAFSPKGRELGARWVTSVLTLLAVVSAACFYHFGMPQFRDESKGRHTLVHPWDMRVYFPLAKYFSELKFDGLYLASVAAYLDNNGGAAPSSIGHVKLRDLTNNQMRHVNEVADQVNAVRARFTPERWESFKKDMRYFERLMGPGGYLGSLQDHGGNATPVWVFAAHLLFRYAPANELTLSLAALVDPLLLAAMFWVLARVFGLRVMLICLIIFGTTDFSRFGTNLMGSTLRADWMAALGFGAAALKRRRFLLGGGLIAYAGLIRAFPALATMFLAIPAVWWLVDRLRARKGLPSWRELLDAQRGVLRSLAGAAGTVVVLFALTSAFFSYSGSWGPWIEKIRIHADKPNTNHVGLRTAMSFDPDLVGSVVLDPKQAEPWTEWQHTQTATLQSRSVLYRMTMLAFVALALIACRGRRLDQAALLGMFLVPIVLYPANYYLHYVFLLPIVATAVADPGTERDKRLFAWVSAVLLAMGVAQYFSLKESWSDVTYFWQSLIVLVGFAGALVPLAVRAWRDGELALRGGSPEAPLEKSAAG